VPDIPKLLLTIVLTIFCSIQAQQSVAGPFIRVIEDGGMWWFEDGQGQRFFSLGVNCVGGCFGHTEDSAMEASRKQRIVTHLIDHGFNTAASWSSPSVWDQFYFSDQIYTGFREERDDAFDDFLWKERFEPCIRDEVKPFLGKDNFIGYFVDNEPRWNAPEIFKFYVGLPRERPGSKAFVSFIESFYQGDINRLNKEWGASYQGFGNIPSSSPVRSYSVVMERGFLRAWRNEVATTYYGRYTALLRSLDPHHLILGVRYRGTPEMDLFRALSPYFDVNSINEYNRYGNLKPEFEALYKVSGKPLMITEFSFSGFPEPGHRSMLNIDVYSQENRGIGYRKYVLEAARAPFMVGMHWFFWMDYPKQDEAEGGFLPDENVGLVTCDESRTYEELAAWIKRTNREVHVVHGTAQVKEHPKIELPKTSLREFTPKLDGDLSDWPGETALKPSTTMSLRDDPVLNHTYFISYDADSLYVAGDVSDSHLENPGGEWFWTGDALFLHLSPEEPDGINASRDITFIIYPVGNGPSKNEPLAVRWCGHDQSMVIPAIIAKHSKTGGIGIEARIPWTWLENFGPRHPSPRKMKLGYQNANEICQAYWTGIVFLQAQ